MIFLKRRYYTTIYHNITCVDKSAEFLERFGEATTYIRITSCDDYTQYFMSNCQCRRSISRADVSYIFKSIRIRQNLPNERIFANSTNIYI